MIDVPPSVSELVAPPDLPDTRKHGATTVHESPLHEGLYQVSVVIRTPGKTIILRYSLTTSRISLSATLWRLKSSRTIVDEAESFYGSALTSYAGHGVALSSNDLVVLNLMYWTGRGGDGALVGIHTFLESHHSVCISAYSGAVMYATVRMVVIRYYH